MKAYKLLVLLLISLPVQAEIYSWVDDQGNRIYSDQNPGSNQASTTLNQSDSKVNYYSRQKSEQINEDNVILEAVETESLLSVQEDDGGNAEPQLTEAKCQEIYGLSCDRVINWKEYAIEKCGSDDRCEDAGFLERKYKPLPIADRLHLANSAGARRNAQEKKILRYLRNKYTDQCENQIEPYCARQADSNSCERVMIRTCEDERSLEEMLTRYNNLSPAQRNRVLALADEMSPVIDWEQANQILNNIINLIVAGAAL